MTLRNFLNDHIDEMVVIKNKYCTKLGEFSFAGKAKFVFNNFTNEALQKEVKRIESTRTGYTIYID